MKSFKFFIPLIFSAFFLQGFLFAEKLVTLGNPHNNYKSTGSVASGCVIPSTQTELQLNNVRALIMTGGDMWWDLKGKAQYEVPKGSGKTALFAGGIWIGGTDVNEQLKLCAIRYREKGTDYWTGPLIESGPNRATTSSDVCLQYDKHFDVTRDEVAKFRAWFASTPAERAANYPGYVIPDVIINWPAHGDVTKGYDYHLAPFYDANGDDYYNPYDGDYPFFDLDGALPCGTTREKRVPRLFGDETLWWIYNDRGNVHTDPTGDAIGMEIHAQAFAFATNDELNNMTFYNYALINRSTYTLFNTYFGVWTDADMGYAFDDYVGCDVKRGLGYLYNGKDVDGTGQLYAYGEQPPAIGMDFFEGPYQDPDNQDNASSWDTLTGNLNCDANIMNGNINGLNFGDGIVDNERWGMRRYIYFNNCASGGQCDPQEAVEYYNFLKGYWKDGTQLFYGGTGYWSDPKTSTIPSDFMFPGDTDPCGWGTAGAHQQPWDEKTEDNPPGDRRFVQSAGPFTLEPGAVNDITMGAVWARATSGGAFASVKAVRLADDKAQLLFDNCFKVVNGPDAPEMQIIELKNQLVFHLSNLPSSNNYLEKYKEKDFSIPNQVLVKDTPITVKDKYYKFEGYQVFQLKDSTVSVTNIHDDNLARLVFQCDIKNKVSKLVNFTWSTDMNANVPTLEAYGDSMDQGIKHTFTITEDMFATDAKTLVNYKKYYYLAIAYSYNNYMHYDQNNPDSINGQKLPYKASRKGATGAIKAYTAIPHYNTPQNGGTIINASYGAGPMITQVWGRSGDSVSLDLTDETINEIMTGDPWKANNVTYKNGFGPINLKVVDPLNVPDGNYMIKFDTVNYNKYLFNIYDSKWYLVQISGSTAIDTIYAESLISYENEQIIPELGLSVTITNLPQNPDLGNLQLSVLPATLQYSNVSKAWLSFLPDENNANPFNWIRSGTQHDTTDLPHKDYYVVGSSYDNKSAFGKILNGTWAPYKLVSHIECGLSYDSAGCFSLIDFRHERLASINVVLTSDKSKWTRCVVVETSENDTTNAGVPISGMSVERGAFKYDMRRSPSIDKEGNFATPGSGPSNNPEDANYIADNGMGWFPGYAIDVETGARLNLMYGEASQLPNENGRDMKWNPTPNVLTKFGWTSYYSGSTIAKRDILWGGKHFIYIMGNNNQPKDSLQNQFPYMPPYDAGKYIQNHFTRYNSAHTSTEKKFKQSIYRNAMWVSIPLLVSDYSTMTMDQILQLSDIKIKLRIANPIAVSVATQADHPDEVTTDVFGAPVYIKYPEYTFSTSDIATKKNDNNAAKSALDLINIVPNPYYGYSPYENNQLDNLVKITNLPQQCTISIYNVNGTLIRRFKKDSGITYQEWDLKNQYSIPIASGVYIIYVKADGVGEKVIKWFGALRPVDLNAF
ncbi:MAG: T9SS type A sorting domain-containing protein [Bacteroidia bacterium]|nr:T9SS type A sorting domain-containing protein [Bacteroidia bacterium]